MEVAINGLGVLTLFLPDLTGVKDLLARLSLNSTTTGIVVINLINEMGSVLLSNTKRLTVHLIVLVHANSFLRLLCSEIALLGFGEVIFLHIRVRLFELHASDALRMVLAGNLNGRVPVTLMLVHVDCLLRLVGFDELFFGFLKAIVILEVQSVFKMDIRELIAGVVFGKFEGIVEPFLVGLEVNSSLNETIFDEELSATFSAHALSNLDGNFSKLFLGAVRLSDTKCLIPEVMCPVHVDCVSPRAALDVVVLSLLEITFHFEGLGQVVVSVLEKVGTELDNKSNHVVKHLRLLIHVDGKIGFSSREVHLFGLLVMTLSLKLLGFLNLNRAILALRQVVDDKLVSLFPLVGAYVHLKSLNVLTSLYEEVLSLLILANLGIMASNLYLVRTDLVSGLVLDEVNGTVPVSSLKSRLNSLVENASLDEVIDGLVELTLRDEPITPFLLESDHMAREGALSKIDGLLEGVAHHERVKSAIEEAHFFEEVAGLLMHVGGDEHVGNLFELVLLDANVVTEDDVGSFGRETTAQIQRDC